MAAQVAGSSRRLANRRGGVSSEPITLSSSSSLSDLKQLKNPKSPEVGERIEKTIKSNILFSALQPDQMQEVLDFMFEVRVKAGDTVITQGDDGDNFYVVDSGEFEIFISFDHKPPVKVEEVGAKGFFGELALMYNCPRAATVKAKTDGSLWALDRITFRRVLLETTNKKRRLYESFLENIPILAPLSHYMRTKVSDVLEPVYFNDGDLIIKQNDQGDSFFIVEEGEAMAYKDPLPGEPIVELKRIKRGDYCGEIALLRKKPRAANVVAVGPTKCVTLDNDSFFRLLGPCEELFQAQINDYTNASSSSPVN